MIYHIQLMESWIFKFTK